MCGIAGILTHRSAEAQQARCADMTGLVRHRGPDCGAVWTSECQRMTLGHRRLSIIDLSEASNQPMVSRSGRYVIVFNGEIYNYRGLRRELDSYPYRSDGDTETILAAVEEWGLGQALARLRGMFAFALWDNETDRLSLVRDRIGIKPLYYHQRGDEVVFCSELRGIEQTHGSTLEVSREALSTYLRLLYIPAPNTIYRGVSKLQPGSVVEFRSQDSSISKTERTYWRYRDAFVSGLAKSRETPARDHRREVRAKLEEAVRLHLESDVPVGLLLSGGVDSSLVGSLLQRVSPQPIKAFSIGFDQEDYDESPYASDVARALGMDHHVLRADVDMAADLVPSLGHIYDEPFADPSSVVTYLVYRLAREHVKVCLSGDGGDEAFYGYTRYFRALSLTRRLERIPKPVASLLARLTDGLNRLLPMRKWETISHHLRASTRAQSYLGFVSKTLRPSKLADVEDGCRRWIEAAESFPDDADPRLIFPYIDSLTYLPEDILTKVDRASMAVSLEARVPLLDHEVIERSLGVPFHLKYRDGRGKVLLRNMLREEIPGDLVDRSKQGFSPPLALWLRTELRDWAEELLSPDKLNTTYALKPEPIRRLWRDFTERGRWTFSLWAVLIYIQWTHTDRTE